MKILVIILGIIIFGIGGILMNELRSDIPYSNIKDIKIPKNASIATFSGGCFWCSESAFQEQEGVYEVISGYISQNSSELKPTYDLVSSGETQFREGVQVYYDSTKMSYQKLLEIYWSHINPTQDDGQFADKGFHYTTAIFYHNLEQKQLAEQSKQTLENSRKFDKPIVTKVIPFVIFYPAEEYHQDYYLKQSGHYKRYSIGSGREGFIARNWNK